MIMQRRQQGQGAEELGHAGSGFVESTERAMACAVRLIDARRREKVGICGEDVLVVLRTMLVLVRSNQPTQIQTCYQLLRQPEVVKELAEILLEDRGYTSDVSLLLLSGTHSQKALQWLYHLSKYTGALTFEDARQFLCNPPLRIRAVCAAKVSWYSVPQT